jgi:hypothetical protein
LDSLIRWSRNFASTLGSVSPATMASTIASPVTPVIVTDDVVNLKVDLVQ